MNANITDNNPNPYSSLLVQMAAKPPAVNIKAIAAIS